MTAIFNFEDPRLEIKDYNGNAYYLFSVNEDDSNFCLDVTKGIVTVKGNDLQSEFIKTCIDLKLTLNTILLLLVTRIDIRLLIDIIKIFQKNDNIVEAIPHFNNQGKTLKDVFKIPVRYIDYIKKNMADYEIIVDIYNKLHLSVEDFNCINSSLLCLVETYNDVLYIKTLASEDETIYKDYRNMIINLTGYPRHPENVSRWHNRAIIDYNKSKNKVSEIKQSNYAKMFLSDAQKFNFKDDIYSIFACEDLNDLITEGCVLHHCVASYVDSVAAGKEYILFLRKNDELDIPYFTIDVCGKQIRQIHGSCNCDPTGNVLDFIKTWINKFELNWSSNSRLCHI